MNPNLSRPFPADAPQTVTVRCSPIDFEEARAQLEQHGYRLAGYDVLPGYLLLTATRQRCTCDLCTDRREDQP